jgi:heptaprenyl diphosphate synthase
MKSTKKVVFLALLVAMALAVSLLESMIPLPFIAPGAKLGLSNIVILVTLVVFGFPEGLTVSVMKSVLLMLVTGSVSSFLYSFAGAVLSCVVMGIANGYLRKVFSLVGVSILGAVSHNFGQLLVASIVLENSRVFFYYPILILTGLVTGYFVGLSADFASEKLVAVLRAYGEDNE